MNRKRLLCIFLAALLFLTACGAPAVDTPETELTQPIETVQTEAPTEQTPEETDPTEPPAQTDATQPEEQTEESTQPPRTEEPTERPTEPPQTEPPTEAPTEEPTEAPTEEPTEAPTEAPEEAPTGAAAIVDAAYALKSGESLSGTYTLSGVITSIKTAYSDRYGNITVIMTVPGRESKPIQCFRLEGSGVEYLAVGDSITVSGKLMNYKGTIEFDAGCSLVAYTSANPTEPEETQPETVWNDDSRDYVASYIHTYGRLPDYFVTKNEASRLYGWSGGSLDQYAPGMCIGGDRFGNYEGLLPDAPGRYWTECDIGTIGTSSRGSKRIVFSNDGLIYYTGDHYGSFTLLYGEP